MSMIGNFKRLTAGELAALRRAPETVEQVIGYGTEPRWYDADDPEGTVLCVEKLWHALHYLLTATAWEGEPPLDFIVRGEELGDDIVYGPARVHDPASVARIHAALQPITEPMLRARFDPAAMDRLEIYPQGWTDRSLEEIGLDRCYEALKDFVARAASAGDALVIWID
jgi:hypothetical protein